MGYETRYTLDYMLPIEAQEDKEKRIFIQQCVRNGINIPRSIMIQSSGLEDNVVDAIKSTNSCSYGPMNEFLNGSTCKWYDHEEDMKIFSKRFPTIIFKLEGVGEEPGDLWVKYFKNGKMQKCIAIISYEEYDESKLK